MRDERSTIQHSRRRGSGLELARCCGVCLSIMEANASSAPRALGVRKGRAKLRAEGAYVLVYVRESEHREPYVG